MTNFYLVRHAHANWTTDANRPLSANGLADAEHVSDLLSEYPINTIYSSPAKRACQTITHLAERLNLAVYIEPDLRERKLGNAVFEDFFKAVETTWQNPSFAHPSGESSLNAKARGIAVVKKLLEKHQDNSMVLSTHENLMALILQGFDSKIDFTFWISLTMPDIYHLTLSAYGMVEKQ